MTRPALVRSALRLLRRAWTGLRAVSGDLAYETYLVRGHDDPPLGRRAFYLRQLRLRYRGPSRCC